MNKKEDETNEDFIAYICIGMFVLCMIATFIGLY